MIIIEIRDQTKESMFADQYVRLQIRGREMAANLVRPRQRELEVMSRKRFHSVYEDEKDTIVVMDIVSKRSEEARACLPPLADQARHTFNSRYSGLGERWLQIQGKES